MEKVTKPNVTTLATGKNLIAKQMKASAGDLLPAHQSNLESILFVHEGECILRINGEEKNLREGEAFSIPPEVPHQIKAVTDFRGVHLMPVGIRFQYFDQL